MKYIDADKLIAEIKRQQRKLIVLSSHTEQVDIRRDCDLQNGVYDYILTIITSLQQEQPDKYETALKKAREWMPNVNQGGHAILIGIFPELGEGLDPRHGGRKQKQPEVDFETEYAKFSNDPDALDYAFPIDLADYKDFARHFYELGLNARKED